MHEEPKIASDGSERVRRFFRFRVGTLLGLFLLAAIALTVGPPLYDWYVSLPDVPLKDEVARFNSSSMTDSIGRFEPPITEAEIVSSIEAQLPNLQASDKVKKIYARIARKKKLPAGAKLDPIPGWVPNQGIHYTVWWVNLNVPLGKNSGYGLRIRENNNPAAKPPNEPRLDRADLSYVEQPPRVQ